MRGDNPIRRPVHHDGQMLEVKSIFATLQGEGPYVGWPAVFIRLGGCNLACDFCDTEFEDFTQVPLADILARVKTLAADRRSLTVITGGEPFRQNIAPLCAALLAAGMKVQIETNGTLWRELPEEIDIICSPKHTGGGYAPVRPDLLPRISAFKFLISAQDSRYCRVVEIGQSAWNTPVYVQPMDEYDPARNAANRELAVKLAMEEGYRLSLQTHKLLGIS